MENLSIEAARRIQMPPCLVPREDVLIANVPMEPDNAIPFSILDDLRARRKNNLKLMI